MSRKLNLLALPKNPAFMKAFVSPPGQLLVQADVAALEPNVLAHFSQDPTFMKIYGPAATHEADVYLIAGYQVPDLGPKIKALYDFNNPTLEGLAAAKKQFSKERKELLKPAMLGWQYGIGAATLAVNLEISEIQARTVLRALDKQFPGRKALHNRLLAEWSGNGGFIINGRGRPLPVDHGKRHDLVSRMVQSTGHDCLVRILWHMNNYRKEHKIAMRPYIPDFHDEVIWAAYPHELQRAEECINYAFDRINDELNWTVTLRHGGFNHGPDLRLRCDGWDNEKQDMSA